MSVCAVLRVRASEIERGGVCRSTEVWPFERPVRRAFCLKRRKIGEQPRAEPRHCRARHPGIDAPSARCNAHSHTRAGRHQLAPHFPRVSE